ncbi:hypothetical protein T07_1204 [Trichinella nelsoni]|uniref:Uncharacterized protein n=1 Tax=Trichinella nelsoni TaxID=6336 RepID=A0A0V0RH05_9BILA|nr:hypothetical protein T07_1204 [Trichinella nelsoni]
MVGRVPNLSIRTGMVSNRLFSSHFPHTSVQCLLFYAYTISSFSEGFLRKSLARSELSGNGPKSTLQRKTNLISVYVKRQRLFEVLHCQSPYAGSGSGSELTSDDSASVLFSFPMSSSKPRQTAINKLNWIGRAKM